MKKLLPLFLLFIAAKAGAQCPEWFATPANAAIIVTKAEHYLGTTLYKQASQPGTNDLYSDKENKNMVYVVLDKDGSVKNVQVMGNKDSLANMMAGFFGQFEKPCVTKKGGRYVFMKGMDVVLNNNNVIWIKRHSKEND